MVNHHPLKRGSFPDAAPGSDSHLIDRDELAQAMMQASQMKRSRSEFLRDQFTPDLPPVLDRRCDPACLYRHIYRSTWIHDTHPRRTGRRGIRHSSAPTDDEARYGSMETRARARDSRRPRLINMKQMIAIADSGHAEARNV
jgi:hypothetical protein